MLSKEMYDVLKLIPRYPNTIFAGKLYEGNPMAGRIKDLITEAAHADYEYINTSTRPILSGELSRTEKGQALVEEYESAERNQRIVDESLKISQKSLRVAQAAKWAAIFGAIAAFLALLPQLPELASFIASLFS